MSGQHRNVARVVEAARAAGLHIEVQRFPEGTRSAADAAAAIGCHVGQIVKSLVFLADGRPVLALVSGANTADPAKLAVAAGAAAITRPDAETVRRITGFPIGGVAPLGSAQPLPTYVDRDLLLHECVWAAAGTWHDVFGVEPAALAGAIGGQVADLAR